MPSEKLNSIIRKPAAAAKAAFSEEVMAQSTLGGSTFTCSSVIGPSLRRGPSTISSLGRGNSTISSSSTASEASRFCFWGRDEVFFSGIGGLSGHSWRPSINEVLLLQLNRVDFNNISAGHIGHQLQRRGLYSFSPHRYAAIEHELKCSNNMHTQNSIFSGQ